MVYSKKGLIQVTFRAMCCSHLQHPPHQITPSLLTCSLARDTHVWNSSSSLDLWYFLVVFTAINMSFSSNGSRDLDPGGPTPFPPGRAPASGLLWEFVPFLEPWSLLLVPSVSMGLPCTTELPFNPEANTMSPVWMDTRLSGCGWVLTEPVAARAGLTSGRGWGRSPWRAGGWRAGMSSRRRPQNARDNRKQSLLTPTEAMCILIGQQMGLISLQGWLHFPCHRVPSSPHHLETCRT